MRSRWIAGALVALLLLYVVLVARSAYGLLISGEALGVAIGVAALAIPVLTVWFLIREIAMARAVDRLAGIMEAEGSLDPDDLPRSPGGRIDRAAATEAFQSVRADVEADPQAWRAWFRLAWAYNDAGDRRRARSSLRTAVQLERRGR